MLFLERMCPWGDAPPTASPCPVVLCQAEDCSVSTSGLGSGTLSSPQLSPLGRCLGDIFTDLLPTRREQEEDGGSYSGVRVKCKHIGVWSIQ